MASVADESNPSDPLLSQSSQFVQSASASSSDRFPTPISYTLSPRPIRDLPFSLLFLLLSLSSISIGFLSISRRNSSGSCKTLTNESDIFRNYSILIWTLAVTVLLVGPIAFFFLSILRRFTKQIVYLTIPLLILIPCCLNVYWFVLCLLSDSCSKSFPLPYRIMVLVFVFVIVGILVWVIVANWHRIELTVKIVKISAAALRENIGLMVVGPGLVVSLFVYVGFLVVFLVFASRNGKYEIRESEHGQECVWREDQWVKWYFGLVIVTMIWTLGMMVEAQAYVISGTVGMWYFAKEGKPAKSIRTSLRNAFGPSFGTVCFSGMVMGIVRVVRAIIDSAEREENAGFVNLVLKCCSRFLLSSFDFVNKFTVTFAAITGEAYCSSAKMTYELLKRNLLSAVFVETVSTRVLAGITFVFSAIYAIMVFAILKAMGITGQEIYIIVALAWLVIILVLGYFVHVLDNVIDTIYVCYAIDRDKGDVCRQGVHEVYVMLPISRTRRTNCLVDRTPEIV